MSWYAAKVLERRKETETAGTLILDVPGWPGHAAGQHLDVRLRAEDGYTATRSYSIASAPNGERVELTVELMPDGEVSPYLVQSIEPGSPLEVLGPIGGWFVWSPQQTEAVQLVAGGSGVVPLMAMLRTRRESGSRAPFRLIYSVRTPESMYYREELQRLAAADETLAIDYAYTRVAPANWPVAPGRIDAAFMASHAWPSSEVPTAYVCGPTSFVESVAGLLTHAGYDPGRVRTERFGPTGAS